jgi:hypothetical protein
MMMIILWNNVVKIKNALKMDNNNFSLESKIQMLRRLL